MKLETARYIVAVADFLARLEAHTTEYKDAALKGLLITDHCPECDQIPNPKDLDDPHATIPGAWPIANIVVIGCEGYKLIDPNRVGIPAPNWQPIDPTDGN